MTTEIAPISTATSVELIDPSDRALERILKQARAMEAAHHLGSALAKTGMVPDIYRDKADDATAAILFGAELGLSAIQSLQNIFIVRGKPAVYSRTMVAQVIAAGHFVYEESAAPESVTWKGRRADSGVEFTSTWTIDRAKAAGFTSNKLYQSMPTEMLRAKAQAEVCRTMAPDVLLGMAHSREELELSDSPPVRHVRNETSPEDLRSAISAPAPEADPTPDETGGPSVAQNRKMHALFRDAGITGNTDEARNQRLTITGRIINRDIETSKDLTDDDANKIIDVLEGLTKEGVLTETVASMLAEAEATK
jgi:hypothetical protein